VGAPSVAWESRLEIIIAVALGLAAIVTAGAVFLNEHQEHKAELDFHSATHSIVLAAGAGVRTPAGHALEARAEGFQRNAEDHQERAATYTLSLPLRSRGHKHALAAQDRHSAYRQLSLSDGAGRIGDRRSLGGPGGSASFLVIEEDLVSK
jgi:hypothetical protein